MQISTLYYESQGTECQNSHLKINTNDFAFSSTNFNLILENLIIESIEPGFISKNNGIEWISMQNCGLWQIEEKVFRDIFEIVANNQLKEYEKNTKLTNSNSNHTDYLGAPIMQAGWIKGCNKAAGKKEN